MTKIKFTGATAIASNHEALTVGAVGLVVRFEFNSAWDGLHKIAVFHCGGVTKDVLDSSFPANICPIPWECLQEEGETLYCGVYGTDSNGNVIIPSKMARLGTVHPAADPTGDESLDPTLPVWQQALNMAQDAMSLLAGKVNRSGDTMQGDLNMGTHTLRLGSTTGMTEDNLNIIRLVADREEEGVTLRNVDTPYKDSDAVNKKYVDDKVNALNTDDIHLSAASEHHSADETVTEVLDGLSKAIINIPTALPNPHKLTINGTSYDGTEDVQMTIQGGGGESILYVNVTQSGSTITGDKTYAEILAAVTANKCVIAKFADANFYLDSVANDKITFQRLDIGVDIVDDRKSINNWLIYVYNDGVWTVDVDFVAVDTAMSDTSAMPVQNKVVKAYIDGIKTEVPTKTSQLTNDSGFLTSHQDISGKQDKATLEADVAAKGFTKNTGTYSKPTGGIPKADLAAAVQTSLGKADTALQEHQSLAAYRTAASQDVIDSGKVDKVTGKGLSTNDYTAAAKSKVDAIPANPKYTDTVYDDTALKARVATIESKESAWDAKSDFSGSYNDLTDKPTIPTALPNPHKLTINGTEYDGSADVQMTIQGGSGAPGADGKSAYQYAVEGGYAGTETEFSKKLASELLIVTITDNNGTLSKDKSYIEIHNAIIAGIPVIVNYDGYGLPLILMSDALYFGTVECDSGDASNPAVVATVMIEIKQNGEVHDLSAQIDIPTTLPNPNALTFTGAVTGTYDGSAALSVEIPTGGGDKNWTKVIDTEVTTEEGLFSFEATDIGAYSEFFVSMKLPAQTASPLKIKVGNTYILQDNQGINASKTTYWECYGIYDGEAWHVEYANGISGEKITFYANTRLICKQVVSEASTAIAVTVNTSTQAFAKGTTCRVVIR